MNVDEANAVLRIANRTRKIIDKYFKYQSLETTILTSLIFATGPVVLVLLLIIFQVTFFLFLLYLGIAVILHIVFLYAFYAVTYFLDRRNAGKAADDFLNEISRNQPNENYLLYEVIVSSAHNQHLSLKMIINELDMKNEIPDLLKRHQTIVEKTKNGSIALKPREIDAAEFVVGYKEIYRRTTAKDFPICSSLIFTELTRAKEAAYDMCNSIDDVQFGLLEYFAMVAESGLGIRLYLGSQLGMIVAENEVVYSNYFKFFSEGEAGSLIAHSFSIKVIFLEYMSTQDLSPTNIIDFSALELSRDMDMQYTLIIMEQTRRNIGQDWSHTTLFDPPELAQKISKPTIGHVIFDDGVRLSAFIG